MDVEPWILRSKELLNFSAGREFVAQRARAYHDVVMGEDYTVQIVDLLIMHLPLHALDSCIDLRKREVGQLYVGRGISKLHFKQGDYTECAE